MIVAYIIMQLIVFVFFCYLGYRALSELWALLQRKRYFASLKPWFRTAVLFMLSLLYGAISLIAFVQLIGTFTVAQPLPFAEGYRSAVSEGNLAFSSRILYHIMLPQRGSIVLAINEEAAKIEPFWRTDVDSRFHILEANEYKSFIQRVVGMPEESIKIQGGVIFVNGQKLEESYIEEFAHTVDEFNIQLGRNEFLLAEDIRTADALAAKGTFHIVHIKQIYSRQLFIFWPPHFMGFVRTPVYNVPNPPVLKIELNGSWIEKFINM